MPVLAKCPLCRAVMPGTRGESRCPRCAELVLPSVRKLCAVCGGDVTHSKRVRDDVGEYYCHDCWAERLAARGEEPGYVCNTCRGLFPSDRVYQDGDDIICMRCFQQRNLNPDDLLEVAAHAGDDAAPVFAPTSLTTGRRRELPWGLICAAVLVLAVVIGLLIAL